MEKVILVFMVLSALGVIGLILLQQGKGAEAGASFGAGASQTVFGSSGSGNFLSRSTAILVTVFFVCCFAMAIVAKKHSSNIDDLGIELPVAEKAAEVLDSDLPVVDDSAPAGDAPVIE